MPQVYEFNNHKYDLTIKHGFAHKVILGEFEIDLLNLFEKDNMNDLLVKLFLNDSLALKLWYHYIKTDHPDYEAALDLLSSDDLERFRDTWWEAVGHFLPRLLHDSFVEILPTFKKAIKMSFKESLDQLETNLDSGSLNSPLSPESIQTPIP